MANRSPTPSHFPLIDVSELLSLHYSPPEEGQVMTSPSIAFPPPPSSSGDSKADAERMLRHYQAEGWLQWVGDWLGIGTIPFPDDLPPDGHTGPLPLWSAQVEILEALRIHKKVAVRSCHGAGKTYLAAVAVLVLFYLMKATGFTTAPTFRQVKRLLWGEIAKLHASAEAHLRRKFNAPMATLGGRLNQTSLEAGGKWFVEGFSTDNPENITGLHERRVFLVLDEGCMVPREIYELSDTILTSEESYVLAIGNPVDPTSPFRGLFSPNSGFHQIQIKNEQTPNVRHGRNVYPELVAHDWGERMRRKHGAHSPWVLARVDAEFPEENAAAMVPWSYLERALQRGAEREEAGPSPGDTVMSLGCDVARKGDDKTVTVALWSDGYGEVLEEVDKDRETDTALRLKVYRAQLGAGVVNVEDIGVGGGVCDILIDDDVPVNEINTGAPPEKWLDDAELFLNKRAYYYYHKLRRDIMDGTVYFSDPDIADQIHRQKVLFRKKIQIMSKDQYRDENGNSPDKADALMLANAEKESTGASGTGDMIRMLG